MTPRSSLRRASVHREGRDFAAIPTVLGDDPARRRSSSPPTARPPRRSPTSPTSSTPCNDHPRDKATFTSASTCRRARPPSPTASRCASSPHRGRTHWMYVQRQPMATELIQLAVGHWDVSRPQRHAGVFIRDVTAPSLTARCSRCSRSSRPQLDWMKARVGRYPFDLYGSLVVDAELGFALETQTPRSDRHASVDELRPGHLGPDDAARDLAQVVRRQRRARTSGATCGSTRATPAGTSSSTPRRRASSRGHRAATRTPGLRDARGADEGRLRARRRVARRVRAGRAPEQRRRRRLYSYNATTAARSSSTRCARRSATGRSSGSSGRRSTASEGESASTDDFIALAAQVSGRDVTAFLRDWLYGTKTPPMPGHPDWTVNPLGLAQTSVAATPSRSRH